MAHSWNTPISRLFRATPGASWWQTVEATRRSAIVKAMLQRVRATLDERLARDSLERVPSAARR